MKILIAHRYFHPDSASETKMFKAIADELNCRHQVTVLTAAPSYHKVTQERVTKRDTSLGYLVTRLNLGPDANLKKRLSNSIKFINWVGAQIIFRAKPDLILVGSVPQVLLPYAVAVAANIRKIPFIYYCLDIHPEVSQVTGELGKAVSTLLRLDLFSCRQAHRIVVLSEDMKQTLIRRDASLASKIEIIKAFDPAVRTLGPPKVSHEEIRILFAGNIGRFQHLPEVVAAILNSENDLLRLTIMGAGVSLNHLAALVSGHPNAHRVNFAPAQSAETARLAMQQADLGLVSLGPGIVNAACPSKIASYLAEGLPLLLVVDEAAALATEIAQNQVGLVANNSPNGNLQEVLASLTATKIAELSAAVTPYWEQNYAANKILPKWVDLVEEAAKGSN